MQLVRKKLTPDELQPPGVRYVSGTDTVQTLVDGSWVDTPAADPRTNPGGLLPPRGTGDTARCDAAANMVDKVKSTVNYIVASEDQAGIASTVLGFFALFLPGIGLVAEAIWLLIDLVISIGAATVASAFTDAVYADMLCYFLASCDSSGQLGAGGLADVLAQMNTNHPGVPYNVFSNIVVDLGVVGLNNAGATGSVTGDCDPCSPCSTYDYSTEPGFYTYFAGSWSAGKIVQQCAGGDSTSNFAFLFNDGTCATNRVASVAVTMTVIGSPTDLYVYGLTTCSRTAPTGQILLASGLGVTGDFTSISADDTTEFYGFQIITSTASGCGTSDVQITAFEYCRP